MRNRRHSVHHLTTNHPGGTRRRDNQKGAYTVKHETAPAPAIIAKLTNEQLLKAWETTEFLSTSPETAITRGWIMDELEKRNPSAFNAWMDSESPEDSTLRRYFTEN